MTISTTHVHTPWGLADSEAIYGDGVVFYGTPSHGGFKLDPACNAEVHPALRELESWYEEDVAAAKVVFSFPELFLEADHHDPGGSPLVLCLPRRQRASSLGRDGHS